jgi:hypothetical protein
MQQYFPLAWRVIKVLPLIGMFFVLANAPNVLRRKGQFYGVLELTLDLLPVVCLVKAGIESFTGDLFPDRDASPRQTLLPWGSEIRRCPTQF